MENDLTWDLSVLYASFDDPALSRDMDALDAILRDNFAFASSLKAESAALADLLEEAVRRLRRQTELLSETSSFAQLSLSADASNTRALELRNKTNAFAVQVDKINSMFFRFLKNISDAPDISLDSLIESSPLLKEHSFFLRESLLTASRLPPPEAENAALDMRFGGSLAWAQMRDILDGGSIVEIELDGVKQTLPLSAVRNMAYSPDERVRKAAYEAELASYKKTEIPLSFALNGIKSQETVISALKGYPSLLDETLEKSRMSRAIFDNLTQTVRSLLPCFERYFKIKARLLGRKNGLPFYDLFAPLPSTACGNGGSSVVFKRYSPDEARAYLLSVFKDFSNKMVDFIANAFDRRWIDLPPREGKGGGAFCSCLHTKKQSRVLVNFTGTFSDITTLAHELGHAYHDSQLYNESILCAEYPTPLAETASIFNETVVTDAALNAALDAGADGDALTLLETVLSDAAQVIVDIYSRYLFESEVVEAAEKKQWLSHSDLQAIMIRAQRRAYGEGLDPEFMHGDMWVCKCHYYIPEYNFYNFPYAFGFLFARGLYEQYKREPDGFVERYEEMLRLTGRASIEDAARFIGIELTDGGFWRAAAASVAETVDRFETLSKPLLG